MLLLSKSGKKKCLTGKCCHYNTRVVKIHNMICRGSFLVKKKDQIEYLLSISKALQIFKKLAVKSNIILHIGIFLMLTIKGCFNNYI